MLTRFLTLTLSNPNPNNMPLRYVIYKCITAPLPLMPFRTPKLDSSQRFSYITFIRLDGVSLQKLRCETG